MRFTKVLLVALAPAGTVSAIRFETSAAHIGWQQGAPAPDDAPIKLHVALRAADEEAASTTLLKVSDPYSHHFRQHLDAGEAEALSRPAVESLEIVKEWLRDHGLWQTSAVRAGMIEIETTIGKTERLLNATYYSYSQGPSWTGGLIRTESYSLPDDVAEHIDFITPTTSFPRRAGNKIELHHDQLTLALPKRESCGANDNVTPTCVRQVYGIDYDAQPNRTTFAVYGTEAASFNPGDLQTYLSKYNPPAAAAGSTFEVIGNGDPNETSPSIESKFETALDTQASLGLAWPAAAILYNNGGVFGPNPGKSYDRFVQFLQELISNTTVPSVVSFSESMPEDMMDPAYARRLCNMMAQVGARGVSLLFSSGDNGPNGDQPSGTHNAVLEPEFPASCPWVTGVGGTTNLANETAATQSTIPLAGKISYTASGGGFSNLFKAPKYQRHAVARYVKEHVPASYVNVSGFPAGLLSTSHPILARGVPDVAAFSTSFPVVVSLVTGLPLTIPIGGTSASTPTWAAVVALLNDHEASKGRPALGFLNPWLYSLQSGLNDITTGGNNVGQCNFLAGCYLTETLVGYDVAIGWDPVTGLGSPHWSELITELDARSGVCSRSEHA